MRIAITGGIAEGKSTILSWLLESGYSTFSADRMVEDIWNCPETPVQLQEALQWPELPSRAGLRNAIADDPGLRARLNAFMHPRVLQRMMEEPHGFFEVPLLVEACLMFRFDSVWLVTCNPETQFERLVVRLGDAELARKLVATQLSPRAKRPFADFVIQTDRAVEELKPLVLARARAAFPTS